MRLSNDIKVWIREKIADALDNLEGMEMDSPSPEGLAVELFWDKKTDGFVDGRPNGAKEFIFEHWADAAETQELLTELGSEINAFADPDGFHVQMLVYGAAELLGDSEYLKGLEVQEDLYFNKVTSAIIKSEAGCDTGLSSEQAQALAEMYKDAPEETLRMAEAAGLEKAAKEALARKGGDAPLSERAAEAVMASELPGKGCGLDERGKPARSGVR